MHAPASLKKLVDTAKIEVGEFFPLKRQRNCQFQRKIEPRTRSLHLFKSMSAQLDLAAYNAQIKERYDHMIAILDDPGWTKEKEEKGVVFYKRSEKGSSFAQVKSVVTISKPIEDVVEVLKVVKTVDENTPKEQREGCIERRALNPIEGDPDNAQFFYIIVESPSRLVTSRDFLMYCKFFRDGDKVSLVRTSIVNDSLVPVNKKYVRANMLFQGFVCEPCPEGTKLTFLAHGDPCGSVPAMVYNAAAVKQGYSAVRIKEQCESK